MYYLCGSTCPNRRMNNNTVLQRKSDIVFLLAQRQHWLGSHFGVGDVCGLLRFGSKCNAPLHQRTSVKRQSLARVAWQLLRLKTRAPEVETTAAVPRTMPSRSL